MENKEIELANELLARFSTKEKILAAAMILNDYSLFDLFKEELNIETLPMDKIDLAIISQLVIGGEKGVVMAVRTGRAMKASLENPIKKRVTLVSRFKGKIKELLS